MLPAPLKTAIDADKSLPAARGQTIFLLIPPPLPTVDELQTLLAPFAPKRGSTSPATPRDTSPDATLPEPTPPKVRLFSTKVPLQPPFNSVQAERWSNALWPVVYNPAAPRATVAPPPQVLSRAQESIRPCAGYYLALARKVAEEAKQSGRGRGVGAVIVDPAIEADIEDEAYEECYEPTDRWMDAVVAVGGDVRYARSEAGAPSQTDLHAGVAPNPASETYNADMEGGPDLHALMRATELVARRRREDALHEADMAKQVSPAVVASDPQLSTRLSPLESYFLYEADTPAAHPPRSLSSPKKRKHEEPNPESCTAPPELDSDKPSASTSSLPSSTPLPAPPPSSTALSDPKLPALHPEIAEEVSMPTSVPTASVSTTETGDGPATPPLTSRIRTRSQGGYLCTDLDVYISHEPCLCCSMGMLLSRFRAVIFPRAGRMQSGGLASEPAVAPTADYDDEAGHDGDGTESGETTEEKDRMYYGLHWRKELNWRALGFEFVEGENDALPLDEGVVFHA